MKVSKVDHTRTAVLREGLSGGKRGVIYYNPKGNRESAIVDDIKKRFNETLNKRAKFLFSILSPIYSGYELDLITGIKDSFKRGYYSLVVERKNLDDTFRKLNCGSDEQIASYLDHRIEPRFFYDFYGDKMKVKMTFIRLIRAFCNPEDSLNIVNEISPSELETLNTIIMTSASKHKLNQGKTPDHYDYSVVLADRYVFGVKKNIDAWVVGKKAVYDKITKQLKFPELCGLASVDFDVNRINMTQHNSYDTRNAFDYKRDMLDEWLERGLRKPLKVDVTYDGVVYDLGDISVRMCKAALSKKDFADEQFDKITELEKTVFLLAVKALYEKKDQSESVARSIENQNVKIQVINRDGRLLLQPSSANHVRAKSRINKKYIFDFLKKYTGADADTQREMIVHIRNLIRRFYDIEPDDNEKRPFKKLDNVQGRELYINNEISNLCERLKDTHEKYGVKSLQSEIEKELKHLIGESRNAMLAELDDTEASDADRFWIYYISDTATGILTTKKYKKFKKDYKSGAYLFEKKYLFDHTFSIWTSFICEKFIDMGKAVFHFTNVSSAGLNGAVGEVDFMYKDGLSSFDYELVKAQETIQRKAAVYVTFAVNNYANAALSEYNSDVLYPNEDKPNVYYSDDTSSDKRDYLRRILRYFGGMSNWSGLIDSGMTLKGEIEDCLRIVRNYTYHYASEYEQTKEGENDSIIDVLFETEKSNLSKLIADKYYSNNTWMFYELEDLDGIIDYLYENVEDRAAQIPSFNRIIPRNELPEFANEFITDIGNVPRSRKDKFDSALYFILKDIYYYEFVHVADSYFVAAYERYKEEIKDSKDKGLVNASKNFDIRYKEIGGIALRDGESGVSFGSFCQQMMIEYNLQNSDDMVEGSGQGKGERIFLHYKIIINKVTRAAFMKYLSEKSEYEFLKHPERKIDIDRDTFVSRKHTIGMYKDLSLEDPVIRAWYVCSHFMSPKNLNTLIGEIRGYLQYVQSIKSRYEITHEGYSLDVLNKAQRYTKLIMVLSFSQMFAGKVTALWTDYYKSLSEFRDTLSAYMDDKIIDDKFMKNSVPVVNRNVVYADMYGYDKLLSNTINRIKYDEYLAVKQAEKEVSKYVLSEIANNPDKRHNANQFQKLINRVELLDLYSLSDLVGDLYGNLVGWLCLRERDMMYLMLGYEYIKLNYSDSSLPDYYNEIKGFTADGRAVDITSGAALYHVVSTNTAGMDVFEMKGKSSQIKKATFSTSIGGAIRNLFKLYASDGIGLEFFEGIESGWFTKDDVDEHDFLSDYRKYIDHFRYFTELNHSMLDLYSTAFDSFFKYNSNLKKSVPNALVNSLGRMRIESSMAIGYKDAYTYGNYEWKDRNKKVPSLRFTSIKPASYTLKGADDEGAVVSRVIESKSSEYIQQIERILEYSVQ